MRERSIDRGSGRPARYVARRVWIANRRRVFGLAVLLSYAVSTIGHPISGAIGAASGCRCCQDLRASDACCCGQLPPTTRSCCTAPVDSSINRQHSDTSRNAEPRACCQETSEVPALSACHCDVAPAPAFVVNVDPRLTPLPVRLAGGNADSALSLSRSVPIPERFLVPETPPPKVRTA